jgi:hypothetical protein
MTKKKYSGYDSFLKRANAIQIENFKKQKEIKNEKKRILLSKSYETTEILKDVIRQTKVDSLV